MTRRSHWQGPALLNVLRVTDIRRSGGRLRAAAAGFVDEASGIFRATRKRIYRLQRASNQFVQSGSLPEALEVWRQPDDSPMPGPTRKP